METSGRLERQKEETAQHGQGGEREREKRGRGSTGAGAGSSGGVLCLSPPCEPFPETHFLEEGGAQAGVTLFRKTGWSASPPRPKRPRLQTGFAVLFSFGAA